ncbi:MAG: HlyD family efflux transporter periplasmic adaptor subunit [Bdellovibrionales bacterium]|nr:HlyD family efflux transporter periplasmic adaptor subunit [Bdellovibrionales bacterium]
MKFELWHRFKDVCQVNRKLVVALILSALGIVFLQNYVSRPDLQILGIADAKEIAVSFDSPVIVRRVFVLPGQAVKQGEALIEVEQTEVNLKLAELQTQLETLKAQRELRNALVVSLSQERKSRGRRAQRKLESPLDGEIRGLEAQLDQVKAQKAMAIRRAPHDGVVASVNYKANESVAPFQAILTFSNRLPNVVYGFVNENRLSDFRVGGWVVVESISGEPRAIKGEIVSLGSRITPFPARLQPPLGTVYYGREVVIAIPEDNPFLMAEKVQIRMTSEKSARPNPEERVAVESQVCLAK